MQPTISTIIPTYNNASFIAEAIASVQSQTYPVQEIIVIDDGSTDDTETVVKTIQEKSSVPIHYIKKENGGPNSARNVGLAKATGEFVAFLDADDRWEPTKLVQQVAPLTKDTELGLVYGNYKIIDTTGTDCPDIPTVPLNREVRGHAFEKLLPGNLILGSASNVLIRKSVFDTIGVFDETLRVGEDWDMWLRITEKFPIEYVDVVTVAIRRHERNQTNNIETLIKGDSAFIKKWIPFIDGKYVIPSIWGDRIIFNIIRGLPKLRLFHIAKQSLPYDIRKKLFPQTYGSLMLACIYFILRAFTNAEMRRRMAASLKRYGKR